MSDGRDSRDSSGARGDRDSRDSRERLDRGDYEAVVYDLDGTLVRLAVDWPAVAAEVRDALAADGLDVADCSLWDCLERAESSDLLDRFEATVCPAERRGAHRSERLPTADGLHDHEMPVGVCSLNCEAACRTALTTHDLVDAVDAVVGRDSVPARKPDPMPLLATLERLEVAPADAVFVGDSERDRTTAARADVPYLDVSRW